MKVFDFLSLSPSLYLLKQDRGKNKLGGFFSIIYLLLMISLTIYYIYIYLSGSDYNLTYYRENRFTFMTEEQMSYISSKQFYFYITNNTNNAKITPLIRYTKNNISDYKPAQKCKSNPSQEFFKNDDDIYCFDLIYYSVKTNELTEGNHFLYLTCEENCTDKNG